jgi:hypothetical protein
MRYEEIIKTVSEIYNNDEINKEGLILVYELPTKRHRDLDEHLFYKSNPYNAKFEHRDVIEVEIGGITIKFVEKGSKMKFDNPDL